MAVDRGTRHHLQPSQLAVRRLHKPHKPVTCHHLQRRMQRKTRQAPHGRASDDSPDLIENRRATQISERAALVLVRDILAIDTAYSMKIGCANGLHSEMGKTKR